MQLECLSLYPRKAAVYFYDCMKDLNEIHTLLTPHFSSHAGRCSSVPVRATTGSMSVQTYEFWYLMLLSRKVEGEKERFVV